MQQSHLMGLEHHIIAINKRAPQKDRYVFLVFRFTTEKLVFALPAHLISVSLPHSSAESKKVNR